MSRSDHRKKFKAKAAEFKEKEIKRIVELSNSSLLKETIELAPGDDYDGCFTPEGEVTFPLLLEELEKRLMTCKFMDKPIFADERYPIE